MGSAAQRAPETAVTDKPGQPPLSGHASQPRLGFGIEWASPWDEFWASARSLSAANPGAISAAAPPATADAIAAGGPWASALRVEWIRGKLPGRAFAASGLSHVAAIMILMLPIWGFLAGPKPDLAPMQMEVQWDLPTPDLPRLTLRAPVLKPKRPRAEAAKTDEPKGEPAYHPRQTIVSIPVHVTHPRQTLIQPNAAPTPPKIVPQLPNIVEWAATAPAPARPKLQLSAPAAPRIQQRSVHDVAAPEVANNNREPGPLNIAPAPTNPQLRMPVRTMSAAPSVPKNARAEAAAPQAAPESASDASAGDASLRRLIALSGTPAPPAPSVSVPQGNLAAPIAVSPEGTKRAAASGAGMGASGASSSSNGGGAGGNANLPASVSITGGTGPTASRAGAGGAAVNRPLMLKPMASAEPTRRGPSVVGAIDPSLPPEAILSGKDVYTLHINMPNLTSATGSWVLSFAELYEDDPPYRHKGQLTGPSPIEKVDPKYPQSAIKQNIDGEVVLYAIIRKDGSVDSVQLVRGIDPALDHNAMEALARWKFRPGTRDGAPVDLEAVVHIPFRFRGPQD